MAETGLTRGQVWKLAIRPKTLPAAIGPVVVGGAFGVYLDNFQLLPVFIAAIGSLLLQILSNLGNDYFDFKSGHDTKERVGPIRVVATGLLSLEELKKGIILNILLAVGAGLYLVIIGGWVILFIGLVSIIFALVYSGGPFPLSSHGLGDIFVFIFFGLVAVNGTYFVQAGHFDQEVVIGSIAVGLLITAILAVNNYRDIHTDRSTGKMTLAVFLGEMRTKYYFVLLLSFAYFIPILLILVYEYPISVLLPLITLPIAVKLSSSLFELKGSDLNKVLAGTARLSLLFSLLYAVGLIL